MVALIWCGGDGRPLPGRGTTSLFDEPVKAVRKAFDGELITAADGGFDALRTLWNAQVDLRRR